MRRSKTAAPDRARAEGRDKDDELPAIGIRIRYFRLRVGLRLKDLASSAGCSESLLSRIENGLVVPSLSTLHRICRALDINVGALIGLAGNVPCVIYGPSDRPRFHPTDGKEGDGSMAESMIPFDETRRMEGLLIHLPPGGPLCGPFRHEGEEVGYVLEGELELTVDGDTHRLSAAHSFFFDSARLHSYRASGQQTCRVVWVNTPPTF